MILETISKYWVQQACVLLLGVITWWYKREVKMLKLNAQDQKALRLAMMALLRDRFYQGYKYHIKAGYFPIKDREIMRDIFEQYHVLGGNGVISHLMTELDE